MLYNKYISFEGRFQVVFLKFCISDARWIILSESGSTLTPFVFEMIQDKEKEKLETCFNIIQTRSPLSDIGKLIQDSSIRLSWQVLGRLTSELCELKQSNSYEILEVELNRETLRLMIFQNSILAHFKKVS